MVRNFRKMPAKVKEKLAQDKRALNRKKDTIHWLVFVPRTGIVTTSYEEADRWNSKWRIELPGNPKNDPEIVPRAIKRFEADRGVKSWEELAVSYHTDSLYFP